MSEHTYVAFDIGGTTTRVGCLSGTTPGKLSLKDVELAPTPQNPEEGIALVARLAEKVCGGSAIDAAAGDISGVVKNGVVHRAPHLPAWDGTDVLHLLEKELHASVFLFNDAALVALGEYFYGAGVGAKVMAYITVSTGVGGARVVEGRLDQGEYNAEIGHQLVDDEPIENLISGTAIEKKYGVAPKDFSDHEVLDELADTLARSLYDNILHWSPDTIVLGGSMITGQNAIPFDRVEETLEELVTTIYPHAPRLEKAKLSKLGALHGARAFLERRELNLE